MVLSDSTQPECECFPVAIFMVVLIGILCDPQLTKHSDLGKP